MLAIFLAMTLPALVGDGVADDTAAIQARLDSGTACVYLPPPAKAYVISKPLVIGSHTELRLDRFSVIRLAPGSNCPMIENRAYLAGQDEAIAITGGVWDMDNLHQSPNPQQYHLLPGSPASPIKPQYDPQLFWGCAMRFSHVENFTVKGLTIRNPTSYGMKFCRTAYLTVDDITFDYTTCNPIFLNMDGVHLDGFCHQVRITNLRGTCFDDMVALNANDGQCAQEEGPIRDVDIDGIYCDYCHSAARLLSTGAPLERVTIRNVHGNFYVYCVGLTHHFPERGRGFMDDIVIENVFAAKALASENIGVNSRRWYPYLWVDRKLDIGSLTIRNVSRHEKTVAAPTLSIDETSVVSNLVLRDCHQYNATGEKMTFLDRHGKVVRLTVDNCDGE